MKKEINVLGWIGAISGLLALGAALAMWMHMDTILSDVKGESQRLSRNISRLRDDMKSLDARVSERDTAAEVALSERDISNRENGQAVGQSQLEALRKELDALKESSLDSEQGEQAVLNVLAKQRANFVSTIIDKRRDATDKYLEEFYKQNNVDSEKASQATDRFNQLMDEWRELSASLLMKEDAPKNIVKSFRETNWQFRQDIAQLLGDQNGARFFRTIFPNQVVRRTLFKVK